jgi:hypothetical protein
MKKSLVVLLIMTITSFGAIKAQSWSDWGSWNSISCFKGVDFRVKTKKTSTGTYEAKLEFRNRYDEKINFTFEAKGGSFTTGNNRISVSANSTKETWIGQSFTSSYFYVNIDRVRFGADSGPFANCDK